MEGWACPVAQCHQGSTCAAPARHAGDRPSAGSDRQCRPTAMPGVGGVSPAACRRGQLPQRRPICGGSSEVQLVMYPAIEPFDQGMLDVGDGNRIYWEVCGNPQGKPAVVLHGGPGSGCTPSMRRFLDPAAYRIVMFDQRG